MLINTTVFCFDNNRILAKTKSRLSTQIQDEITTKLYNKMNLHAKAAALNRKNAFITSTVDGTTGYIRCNDEIAYIITMGKVIKKGMYTSIMIMQSMSIPMLVSQEFIPSLLTTLPRPMSSSGDQREMRSMIRSA